MCLSRTHLAFKARGLRGSQAFTDLSDLIPLLLALNGDLGPLLVWCSQPCVQSCAELALCSRP